MCGVLEMTKIYIGGAKRSQKVAELKCRTCGRQLKLMELNDSAVGPSFSGDLPFQTNEEKNKRAQVYRCGQCGGPQEYLFVDLKELYNYYARQWRLVV
jgi:hypothetical protein